MAEAVLFEPVLDDDRDAAVYLPDGPLDDLGAFGIGQRRALAWSSRRG